MHESSLVQLSAPSSSNPPFRAPATARAKANSATKRSFRPKQPVRRAPARRSPSPTNPEGPSHQVPPTPDPHESSASGGPSKETMAAAGASTCRLYKFMATPGLKK
ncbi:hypothetical protein PIB30_077987 [Stylosanthes scabra]|uniref:Uncharacterized protein n=1 Tax=Stylosanthes scabra TaxID=79078 RepID=A0ABU6ZPB1_9FABA|nr:hypothetical protein [Stylosanthes scabra]